MEPCELQNELVSAEGRNRKAVLCQRCGSRVLQPGTALFSRRQLFLPSMRKKPDLVDGSNPDGDVLEEHWLVNDMFIFENVGFTKDVGNVKFLVCADCEIGPIGWHCLDDKNSFYVALERVSHE
ncbi:rCG46281, isoform CRA_a [Rattus norvegicus]|uniref:Guanine nucleotide exchange factor MSS4 n=3 Tax=Rattus norvegicus TaxID=10116 RepID=MSS4_RAT|nr:guanine nucleotide exchange factor MSS4 [Rattus norvegicus]Q08326.1 RecName: Full=Guanine nucleotide exchange factor MSS4; AltName: Full=Rab-interacting factor [Rattus norvegicus]AAI61807.1 RAB interacting factor [Rattus norvegicus]EDM09722.1 rCG46281, isoform CRA_a [Rattus norvegicus]CAA49904.1 Mss4 protein [Rattus norvegicus]prf//1907285A guanine nucleotide-releasing protein [Rattus norvegicus]|eukprot:NP_001007679.1 guanine nucleotide exchange factor MSS4 [Rattus norvegicus]